MITSFSFSLKFKAAFPIEITGNLNQIGTKHFLKISFLEISLKAKKLQAFNVLCNSVNNL